LSDYWRDSMGSPVQSTEFTRRRAVLDNCQFCSSCWLSSSSSILPLVPLVSKDANGENEDDSQTDNGKTVAPLAFVPGSRTNQADSRFFPLETFVSPRRNHQSNKKSGISDSMKKKGPPFL